MGNGNPLALYALPINAGVRLLIQLQRPCQAEPYDVITARLQVKTMTGSGRVRQQNWNLPGSMHQSLPNPPACVPVENAA